MVVGKHYLMLHMKISNCLSFTYTWKALALQLVLVVHLSLLGERTGNDAVTCVRGHAGAIDGRNPVVVAGNSAGGTLSAVMAQKARKHGGTAAKALAAQVIPS